MSLLHATGLKRAYGAHEVLRGADLRIEAGDKIGVVGRNGAGKTTLLRIIEGEEKPDSGELNVARGARLGYVLQRPRFEPGQTVRQFVETGLDEVHGVAAELERVGEEMAHVEGDALDKLIERHGALTERMEFLGGWETERRAETVMGGIGLPEELWDREAETLSGGEKSRTSLAKELVSTPDLLLLDEPTNHLDLAGIEWLEAYINELKGAVVIVSHDRRLLDNAVTSILDMERGELVRYVGGYSKYLDLKEERFRTAHRAWQQQHDFIRKETAFIKKHMGSQRTAEAKGRQKKLSHVVRLERPFHDVRRPTIQMAKAERGGELVLDAEGLTIGYDDNLLFQDAAVRIGRGERIGIVGPNGAGKSSLLRVLAGRDKPLAGNLSFGHKARVGYYDQETSDLDEEASPYQMIRRNQPNWTDLEIRSHLAKFLFRGDEVESIIGTLSGGERARVTLSLLMLSEPSWLALDEPTNHLDLAARTALEEFLGNFQGALVCVSHDREFLDGLCTTILEVDGGVRRFKGNYSEYRAEVLAEADARVQAERDKEAARKARAREEARKAEDKKKKESKKAQGGGAKGKGGAKQPKPRQRNPWKLERIEKEIMSLEEKREGLLAELATEEVYRNADLLRDKQMELAEIERDLEERNAEWESFAS